MHTFVDHLAAHDPDRPAITTPDGDLTYGDLVRRIDALAATLQSRGAGPETVCAVAVPAGVDAVVATGAVTRAGAAFLTLDVEQPAARLDGFLRSGGAGMLVTTADGPPLSVPGPTIRLDDVTGAAQPVRTTPVPSALAYVSHTSGSTGEPRAVLIEHRGLTSYLKYVADDFRLGPDTVALQVAPMGYDASLRDTFAPLLAGGRLVMVARSALLRPDEWVATIRRYGVNTLLSVTPSFLTHLAGQPRAAESLADLRLVVTSGESLRPFLSAGGRSLIDGALINQYGPTECTMTSTRYVVPERPRPDADVVGVPITGVVVRLLDQGLRPVPTGTVGEVHIGGAGVARGYHGRPGDTADLFVPDPLGPPGSRLYRTGDLARSGPGGLHYLGRRDRQLKIRGYRVDPAEVEGALLTHPAVSGAVVTSGHDDRGRVFLLAHVTGDLAGTTDTDLRRHLTRTLPPHLVPRRIIRLDALPRTRSGKTDRRALIGGAA